MSDDEDGAAPRDALHALVSTVSGISLSDQALGMLGITLFGLLFLLGLVLTWIDIRHGIIPNWLNLTIAGLGLSKAVIIDGPAAGLEAACEGAAIGAIFWLLRWLYFAFRKVQGIGLGDVKFLAAAGIWIGVSGLPMLLLVATLTALACAGIMQWAGRSLNSQTSMSFGPFLAIGLLFASGFQQHWFCCPAIN
jgi:leader peptidase (prepilin peptidase) / N-methyltransferase